MYSIILVRHSCPPLQVAVDRCDVDASILKLAVNIAAKAPRSGLTTKREGRYLGTKGNTKLKKLLGAPGRTTRSKNNTKGKDTYTEEAHE